MVTLGHCFPIVVSVLLAAPALSAEPEPSNSSASAAAVAVPKQLVVVRPIPAKAPRGWRSEYTFFLFQDLFASNQEAKVYRYFGAEAGLDGQLAMVLAQSDARIALDAEQPTVVVPMGYTSLPGARGVYFRPKGPCDAPFVLKSLGGKTNPMFVLTQGKGSSIQLGAGTKCTASVSGFRQLAGFGENLLVKTETPLSVVSVLSLSASDQFELPPREVTEMFVVTDGAVEVKQGQLEERLKAGEGVLVPPASSVVVVRGTKGVGGRLVQFSVPVPHTSDVPEAK